MTDPLQQRREIFAVDELHREKRMAVHFRNVVDAADVRMRHLPRPPYFRVEPLAAHYVIRERFRQEFERDRLSELQIVGTVDLAHPAASEKTDDAESAGETRPRRVP